MSSLTFGGSRPDDDLPSLKDFRAKLRELDERPKPQTIEEAKARLAEALSEARVAIVEAREQATLTEQEREDLTLAAQRGQLGPGLREIGDDVAAGRATWDEVMAGSSEHSAVFAEFLRERAREDLPALREKMEQADLLR